MGIYFTFDQIDPPAATDGAFEALLSEAVSRAVRHGLNRANNLEESWILRDIYRDRSPDGKAVYLWVNRWEGVGPLSGGKRVLEMVLEELVQQLESTGARVTPTPPRPGEGWEVVALARRP